MSKKLFQRAIASSAIAAAGMLAFTAPALADNVTTKPCTEVTNPDTGDGTIIVTTPGRDLTAEELQAILDELANGGNGNGGNGDGGSGDGEDIIIGGGGEGPGTDDSDKDVIIVSPSNPDIDNIVVEGVDLGNHGGQPAVAGFAAKESGNATADGCGDPVKNPGDTTEDPTPEVTDPDDLLPEAPEVPEAPGAGSADLAGIFGSLSNLSGLLKF